MAITSKQVSGSVGYSGSNVSITANASCVGGTVTQITTNVVGSGRSTANTNAASASFTGATFNIGYGVAFQYDFGCTFSDGTTLRVPATGENTSTVPAAPHPAQPSAVGGFDAGSGYAGVSWNFNSYPGYTMATLLINGTSFSPVGNAVDNRVTYVGYGVTVSWSGTDNYGNSYSGNATTGTPPAPPVAPNPATSLTAFLIGNMLSTEDASFEGGTTGTWFPNAFGGTAAALSNYFGLGQDGIQSLQLTWPTAIAGACTPTVGVSNLIVGNRYTISAYVYVPFGNPAVRLGETYGQTSTTVPVGYVATTNINDTFQRVALTFVAALTTHYFTFTNSTASTAGQSCFLDAVQIFGGSLPIKFAFGGSGSFDLNWVASVGGAAAYTVYRNGVAVTNQAGTNYTDSAPGVARPLTYQIIAYNQNSGGTSASGGSNTVTFNPPPQPSAVTASDIGGGSITLTWNFTPYPGYTAVRGTVNGATQTVSATKSGSVSVHVGYKTVAAWSLTDNYGNIYNGSLTTGAPAISDSVGILVG